MKNGEVAGVGRLWENLDGEAPAIQRMTDPQASDGDVLKAYAAAMMPPDTAAQVAQAVDRKRAADAATPKDAEEEEGVASTLGNAANALGGAANALGSLFGVGAG